MNSAQQQIILALSGGTPLTAEAIAAATGLPARRVRVVIDHLRDRDYIESIPKTYALTEKGAGRAKAEPKRASPMQRPVRQASQVAAANEDTVTHAKRTQPELATVWMATA